MSADNWTSCPRCMKVADKNFQKQKARVAEAYGKVEAGEYLNMVAALDRMPVDEDTFREDYEIGIYKCQFNISYRGYCSKCTFSFTFEDHREVEA